MFSRLDIESPNVRLSLICEHSRRQIILSSKSQSDKYISRPIFAHSLHAGIGNTFKSEKTWQKAPSRREINKNDSFNIVRSNLVKRNLIFSKYLDSNLSKTAMRLSVNLGKKPKTVSAIMRGNKMSQSIVK